jgi:hypothetical protein
LFPEVGAKKDGAFGFKKFLVDVLEFIFGPFDGVDIDGEENFFFDCFGDPGIRRGAVLEFDMDELIGFYYDIGDDKIRFLLGCPSAGTAAQNQEKSYTFFHFHVLIL